jgi:hypothetical protein
MVLYFNMITLECHKVPLQAAVLYESFFILQNDQVHLLKRPPNETCTVNNLEAKRHVPAGHDNLYDDWSCILTWWTWLSLNRHMVSLQATDFYMYRVRPQISICTVSYISTIRFTYGDHFQQHDKVHIMKLPPAETCILKILGLHQLQHILYSTMSNTCMYVQLPADQLLKPRVEECSPVLQRQVDADNHQENSSKSMPAP